MKANYYRQDDWEREIYRTPSGEDYAMIQGSIHTKPILYAIERSGEPSYPIKIKGEYITADKIEGIKPEICINCKHHLGAREASKRRTAYRKHAGQEVPTGGNNFLCDYCEREANR